MVAFFGSKHYNRAKENLKDKKKLMNYSKEEKEYFMLEALKEARIALENDEIPIGCVVVKDGQIIGRGHNAREELQRAVMHAEIMAIEEANQHENRLVIFPTETVYGIGTDGLNYEAVSNIYKAKGRPSDNPLILHVCDLDMVRDVTTQIGRASCRERV